ncbi:MULTISPECIES: TadE/TadG family type IV pilus assembly protein [Arthrobacter]|uniref:TadE/TadG family type IV pilus assembly protein n=1 Tax=Arthrobacter TaxID=1663 RepID=UPI00215943C6|nr:MULTISPECIES: TadE family protein [Arthrobacter]
MEFALIVPLLLSLLLGVIDFGMAFGQYVSLQGAAREAARQGIVLGDVVASANTAKGVLDSSKLEVRFAVDVTAGAPGVMVVCLRYPRTSLTGFFNWTLNGHFQTKALMRMEGTALVTAGLKSWTGGLCTK